MMTLETRDFEAEDGRYLAALTQARTRNRAVLFDALAKVGITAVIVSFDGCGDSGQIENIEAKNADDLVDLLSDAVAIAKPEAWGSTNLLQTEGSLTELIEQLAYDFLSQTHSGWENNDGAYGEFTFDLAAGNVTLDYNERYTATDYSQHEL